MEVSQVQELRQQMAATGWAPIPLVTNDKAVKIANWSNLARQDSTYFAQQPARADMLNTGFLCDGLRVVDIDIDDREYVGHVARLAAKWLGDRPLVRKRSNSERLALVYRAAEGAPVKVVVNGKRGKVEILGRGQQLHAFGLHPSGVEPQWVIGFQNNRAARITELQWVDPTGSNPEQRFPQIEKRPKQLGLLDLV